MTLLLTIEASPVEGEETGLIRGTSDIYLPAEQNDYELTPVTIDKQAGQATFEIRAVDDSDYDPLESVMLELVSHSDDVQVVSPNSLKLKIGDNDPRPFVSFSSTIGTQRLNWEYENVGVQGSSVLEGDKRDYRIVLDRKSNRDTEFVVYLGGGDTPLLLREDGETPFPHSTYWSGPKYQDGEGYWSWSVREEWERVIIPAGELGLTFTVDTTSLENDLYDYYWDRALAVMFIYVYKEHYAYTDEIGSKHYFFLTQDEPAPQLLLKNSANDGDGDASITVSEGESFDIWVDISHQLGTLVIFDEPGLNLKARLTATTVSGAELNLDLPDVLIGAYQSGVTVTVQIPAGSLANGEGTVILALEDVAMTRRGPGIEFENEISVRVPNRLVVTILDDEPPVVSVRRFGANFGVNEGGVAGLIAELIPAPQGGADRDITVHLASGSWSTASANDYSYPSSVTIPRGQSFVRFDVRALDDNLPEYPETFNVHVSSVDYAGRNYVQTRGGVDLTIISDDRIEPVITVLGGTDHLEGSTVTVRIAVSQVLPANIPVNAITLSVLLSDSVRSVSVDGRSLGSEQSRVLYLVNALKASTSVDVVFSLTDDYIAGPDGFVKLNFDSYNSLLLPGARSYFRIVDNDEPLVSVRSLSVAEGGVEVPDLNSVNEGDTVQLEVELTNASEGGAPQDITVNLATGNEATASESDYSYPSSVTIPQGQSRVTFEVSASQDDLVEDGETLNIYVSSVDFNSQNYEQSDAGVDLTIVDVDFNDPPIVSVRRFGANFGVNEGGVAGLIAELIPAPQGGADRDITVHLASGSWSTASANDYSYPSSVAIPQGQSFVRFDVRALDDNLPEYPETFNVHVSSVDYAGRNYVQTRGGVDLTIISDDRIEPVITVLGGTDHLEGSTVTVRIAVSQVLPANIPVNAITLSVLLSDSVRSVSVDGRSLGSEQSRVLYLVNALKASTSVDVVFSLTDDYIAGPDGFVILNFDTYNSLLLPGARSYFRIVDNDEPPVVVVPDPVVIVRSGTSTSLTSTSSVRRSDLNRVSEGDTVQLVAELTNAPEGGAAEDITVFLAARAGGTAKPEDVDFPSSVTIAAGDSSVSFLVSAIADDLVEYDEKVNIYAASVEYGDSSLTLSDSGYDLTISSADRITARIAVLPSSDLVEGGTVTIRIVLSSPLPARVPVESLYLVPGSGYADIDITEGSGVPRCWMLRYHSRTTR